MKNHAKLNQHQDVIEVRVLVLDDNPKVVAPVIGDALGMLQAREETETRWTFSFGQLGQASLECEFISDAAQAESSLRAVRDQGTKSPYKVVLIDNNWTDCTGYSSTHGLVMLEAVGFPRSFAGPIIAMFTASPDYEATFVARALGAGAQAFVVKTEKTHLLNLLFWAIDRERMLQQERRQLQLVEGSIVRVDSALQTRSPSMEECLRDTAHYAMLPDLNLLIVGESGTGKSRLARAIHDASRRAGAPFEAIDFGQIPPEQHYGVLFGQEDGAGGASHFRPGLLENTAGGTLLIKAVHRLSTQTQQMLLGALDGGVFRRVGGTEQLKPNVRIICSMTGDPSAWEDTEFRDRITLGGIIRVPRLAERREDIPDLAKRLLANYNQNERAGRPPLEFSHDALSALAAREWPGNVRELRATVLRSAARMSESTILNPDHLSFSDMPSASPSQREWGPESIIAALRFAPRRNTSQRQVFDLLLEKAPNIVSRDMLHGALREEHSPEYVLLNVISRLRNRLKDARLEIQSDVQQSGYRLFQRE